MTGLLLIFGTVVVALFLTGETLFRICGVKSGVTSETVFRNVFTSYVLVISLYSLIQTKGVTANIIYLLIFSILLFEYKRTERTADKFKADGSIALGITCLIGVVFVFSWAGFSATSNNPHFLFNYTSSDYILYARIAKSIGDLGLENGFYFLNSFDDSYHGPEPYHYFDLWGASLIAEIFRINTFVALKLIVYPLFYFLVFLAYCSLINGFFNRLIAGVLLLFAGGVYFTFYDSNQYLQNLVNIRFNLMDPGMSKLAYFYVFFSASYLLFKTGLCRLSIIVLMGLPVANIVSFPIYFALIAAFLLMHLLKQFTAKDLRDIFLYTCAISGSLTAFYIVFKKNTAGLAGADLMSPIDLMLENFRGAELGTRFNILAGSTVQLIVLYLPFFLIVFLYFRREGAGEMIHPFFLVVLCVFVSLLAWAVLFKELNSSQVFTNIAITSVNFLMSVTIIRMLNETDKRRHVRIMLVPVLFILCYNLVNTAHDANDHRSLQHSMGYLEKIQSAVVSHKLQRGVSIKDSTLLVSIFDKYNSVYPLGNYLMLMNDNISIVNIGDFNTPIDSTNSLSISRSVKAVQNGVFYKFAKDEINGRSVADLQCEFIERFEIDFLIASSHAAIPVSCLGKQEHVIIDPVTGERFIRLARK